MVHAPSLQSTVDRYAKSLAVPHGLTSLHNRNKHRPTQAEMSLAPAIVLTSVSAFEGFVEEFIAVTGAKRNLSFAQIVKLAHTNAPSLGDFEKNLVKQLGSWSETTWSDNYTLELYQPPELSSNSNWWRTVNKPWSDVLTDAEGWLQVRHSLAHGLTRGYLSESWPSPMGQRGFHVPANHVLREQQNNRHSLTLHGAINCARILRHGAEILCEQTAKTLGEKPPRWRAVPPFPLVTG